MTGWGSIEAVIELLLAKLSQFRDISVTVERMISIQPIPILRTVVISLQNRIRIPSLTIKISMISRKSASLSIALLCLKPLVSLTISWVHQVVRSLKWFVSCWSPISLFYVSYTFQPGWARWISVLPYLLLDATLEVSIRASLLRLNPVDDRPKLFRPRRSFWKLCFAIAEKPLAWIFSALIEGMYPPYPGTTVFFGSRESYINKWLLCCGNARTMTCTCCFVSTSGSLVNRSSCCGRCSIFTFRSCSWLPSVKNHRFARSLWSHNKIIILHQNFNKNGLAFFNIR